jgi:signal peptidase I
MRSTEPEEEPDAMRQVPGGRSARRPRGGKQKKGSFWRELPILIITAVVLTILIQTFLARVYVIPSQSMELTLHGCTGCQDDRVLVDKLSYRFSSPQPGNVVVFRGPPSWTQNEFSAPEPTNPVARVVDGALSLIGFGSPNEKDFIKRVIATGGQTVQCCDTQNRLLVDGKPLNEPYVYWEPGKGMLEQRFGPVTVPAGDLWVMGDNRNDSDDSRFQGGGGVSGAVPVQDVIGRARVIVLPPTRWGGIPQPNPQQGASAAPAWQSGLPLGTGVASAFPVVWLGRRLVGGRTDRRSQEPH